MHTNDAYPQKKPLERIRSRRNRINALLLAPAWKASNSKSNRKQATEKARATGELKKQVVPPDLPGKKSSS